MLVGFDSVVKLTLNMNPTNCIPIIINNISNNSKVKVL